MGLHSGYLRMCGSGHGGQFFSISCIDCKLRHLCLPNIMPDGPFPSLFDSLRTTPGPARPGNGPEISNAPKTRENSGAGAVDGDQ